jgi:molecular chaperone IbpA
MLYRNYRPLYRSGNGFDRLASLLDSAPATTSISSAYPPYDIEHDGGDQYTITIAVTGFKEDDLNVEVENGFLRVKGTKAGNDTRKYIHKGIAARNFERRFELANHMRVTDAKLSDGQLKIHVAREIPEEMRPRSIAINSSPPRSLVPNNTEKVA